VIETERLFLRPFREADRDPWAAMNADPEVMRYFPSTLTRPEADALMDRVNSKIADIGVGFWALERKQDGMFLGFAGLNCVAHEELDLRGMWEVGWRLRREAWGQGYASEAGRVSLQIGFESMGLRRIIAYTAAGNRPSELVMQRIGMLRAAEMDFEHPAVPVGSPVRPHIVYVKDA
jgi:RimJ/RimL family protein N-acetyltransferase